MSYGIGDAVNQFAIDFLDVALPIQLVDELNKKASYNPDENQLNFEFKDFNGFLGPEEGQLTWEGDNSYKYNLEITDFDGLEGTFKHEYSGEVLAFWQEQLDIDNWESVNENYAFTWAIDPVNFKADFGYTCVQNVTAVDRYSWPLKTFNNVFNYEGKIGFEVKLDDDSFKLKIPAESKVTGWDEADPVYFGSYWYGDGDHDFKTESSIAVPDLNACQSYFDDFNPKSVCVVNVSNDFVGTATLKLKHKFAFVQFDNFLAYVRSENFNGVMTGFDESPYLSFYFTEDDTGAMPFRIIKKSKEDDLYLTIPFFAIEEVADAFEDFANKFGPAFDYLLENPVKSAYWIDSFFNSVQPTTFDLSPVVEVSRFAIIDYPNADFVQGAKDLSNAAHFVLSNADFGYLEAFRAYVVEVQNAKADVEENFVLPQ